MAIKSISKLDQFYNGTWDDTALQIGGELRWLKPSTESEFDSIITTAPEFNGSDAKTRCMCVPNSPEAYRTEKYPESYLELSQPINVGTATRCSMWNSRKMTYRAFVQNVIADTVTYLNWKHQLGNYNLHALINGDRYEFNGDKIFKNDVVINETLYVKGESTFDDRLHVTKNGIDIRGDSLIACNTFNIQTVNTNLTATDKFTINANTKFNAKWVQFGDSNPESTCNISCYGNVELTANHAKWSDLAEYYIGDSRYAPGTLVSFGGENEITIATKDVNAVITSKPAFLMNSGLKDTTNGCAIALAGRVPVRVSGKVQKFDKLVLSKQPGIARRKRWYDFYKHIIGIALESTNLESETLIECVVKFRL